VRTDNLVISEQSNFSALVNLAGHQGGLANRIAYFSSLMVTTSDEAEFNIAKAQVGRTINKMRTAHDVLRKGDLEKGIPHVTNDHLQMIYDDPMVGLDTALDTFLAKASALYDTDMGQLTRYMISAVSPETPFNRP